MQDENRITEQIHNKKGVVLIKRFVGVNQELKRALQFSCYIDEEIVEQETWTCNGM
jgi:hypothetical protein